MVHNLSLGLLEDPFQIRFHNVFFKTLFEESSIDFHSKAYRIEFFGCSDFTGHGIINCFHLEMKSCKVKGIQKMSSIDHWIVLF